MRRRMTGSIVFPASVLLMFGCGAMAAEEKPKESFTYATYHVCDLAKQERADEIYEQIDKPLRDAAVADGTLTAYGYNVHHTGGRWRRVDYTMAPSIEALLAAQKKLGDQAEAKSKELDTEFATICNAHDDYIWRRKAGTIGTTKPGAVSFSVYYVCDEREDQADTIVEQLMAPVYDRLVKEGKLATWGWMEHIVGAQFRRLGTMTAKDLNTLMAARAAVIEATDESPLGTAFTDICDAHADYIWEVKFSKP